MNRPNHDQLAPPTNAARTAAVENVIEASPEHHPLTQLGNAERFVDQFGKDVLYCPKIKQWYVWDGSRWAPDDMLVVRRHMTTTVRGILREAATIQDREERETVVRWERQSESEANIRGALTLAQHKVAVPDNEFDQNLWLLNFPNGTLDLQTDKFRECRREDRLTKCVSYDYDDFVMTDCPRWKQFLKEIFPPPYDDIIPYLRRAVGYSLTGFTEEHCLFLLRGDGRNGKSVFIRTLQYVLGDYAAQADWQSFTMRKNSGLEVREDIARLAGARFVAAVESAQHSRMAENVVKAITGGDRITARHLFKGSFEFQPQFKLWLASNYVPKIVGVDEGIWSRLRYIPFTVTIPEHKRDRNLVETLQGEAAGILNWARHGLKDYLKNGMQTPKSVLAATDSYRNDSDQLNHFLNARTIHSTDQSRFCGVESLYKAYSQWALNTGETYTMPQKDFDAELERRGMNKHRTKRGMVWKDITFGRDESVERLREQEDDQEELPF